MNFNYKKTTLIPERDIAKTAARLKPYLTRLQNIARAGDFAADESSINLPIYKKGYGAVERMVEEKKTKELKYIIVCGIGGSDLGATAVYEALTAGLPYLTPKILFANTVSAALIKTIEETLKKEVEKPEEVLLNLATKSGTNTEPMTNFERLYSSLQKRFGNRIVDRVVVTTANKELMERSDKNDFAVLTMPDSVGGRYSVFTAVGLFPLMMAGFDGAALLEGASAMRKQCLRDTLLQNPALVSAVVLFLGYRQGYTIHSNFFFNPELESLGKWYRQLMAESIGKETDAKGKVIHAGITPMVSIGTNDLHSTAQLYLGGPQDKMTYFTYAPAAKSPKVPSKLLFGGLLDKGVRNKSYDEIMETILTGVKIAYKKRKLPFAEVVLPELSAYTLGQYLQWRMMEMMFLGKLLNVNTFDQPNVEEYKREVRKIL